MLNRMLTVAAGLAIAISTTGASHAGYNYTAPERQARWKDLQADIFGARAVRTDDNPSPLAAHFTFGPDADPAKIKLRVRVNLVTEIHAIAETKQGGLIESARLVKASGGCSAPMGVSDEEAMRGIGQMKLRLGGAVAAGLFRPAAQRPQGRSRGRHERQQGWDMVEDLPHPGARHLMRGLASSSCLGIAGTNPA